MITTKALLLYRPGEACGLLESIFQPIVQACGSFRLVVTFGSREYLRNRNFSQPVQLRVLNVIKHWVDQHFYDFEQPDGHLIDKLEVFLNECSGKAMHKWVDGIRKKIYLRVSSNF